MVETIEKNHKLKVILIGLSIISILGIDAFTYTSINRDKVICTAIDQVEEFYEKNWDLDLNLMKQATDKIEDN